MCEIALSTMAARRSFRHFSDTNFGLQFSDYYSRFTQLPLVYEHLSVNIKSNAYLEFFA